MKSVIICEGNTDLLLIQYFLEKVYNWEYIEEKKHNEYDAGIINKIKKSGGKVKWLKSINGDFLCILPAGGVTRIPEMISKILDLNKLGTVQPFTRIAIVTDRDEVTTEQDFIAALERKFTEFAVGFSSNIVHNEWNSASYINDIQDKGVIVFLPLIIPFEETGAIETFLLDALSKKSEIDDSSQIDKCVIEQCRNFVNTIECKDKYLKRRREKTKAKFDIVFAVMSPIDAFSERRTLLRSIPWEQYESIQSGFKQLSQLSAK